MNRSTTLPTGANVPVPPLALAASFAELRDELLAEMSAIAESGYYVLGPKVAAFEDELAAYCGAKYALGLSSGTDAALAAMMAYNVGPGDEVIVPSFTFFATAGTVARLGARPVFCDVDPVTYNIDPADAARKITPRTRGIMPVDLYGQLYNVDGIAALAKKNGLFVIEDAAQAIGACFDERPQRKAGCFGDMGVLSFYPTKNLGAMGDAGAIVTDNADLYERCKLIRVHGSGHTYFHKIVGGNFRIDALQAAILRIKLRHLEAWTEARRARADRYTALLTDAGLTPEFVRPPAVLRGRHVYHQYVLNCDRRDGLMDHLKSRSIGGGIYYPLPLHLQECFAALGGKPGDFPESERAAQRVLALPIYPELTEQQQETVVAAIREFYMA